MAKVPADGDYRQWCMSIILIHTPIRSWRSLWRIRCSCCHKPWETGGALVGCKPVRDATAELGCVHRPNNRSAVWSR